ncbi:MAG TPA: ATP-binding protein [Actinomycetes bacterium]|nr:ATP-binding protein [Actinomycetes bacterium]
MSIKGASSTYDELPDGVVVVGSDGVVCECNRAATRLLGVRADELIGLPLADALPLADSAGRDWWMVSNPFGGLSSRSRQVERVLQLPDGRYMLVTAAYVRETRGAPVKRLVVSFRGTEARDRAEREHADLIATVAHELRSPLTGVKGFTSTLLKKWDRFTEEQRRLMLEAVDSDADRLTRLIAELLDVARIDAGRLELRRVPTDLGALVRRRVEAKTVSGVESERFVLQLAEDLPEAWVDPDKIGQVIDNLLENALRHGDGTVTVTVRQDPDGLVLAVADQGAGVPVGQAHRIFGRFWKGTERGGTGLGLYVVNGIVEGHGGRVALVPPPEGGARFVVVLPLRPLGNELGQDESA